MASTVVVPVSEYLATTYRPDCDFLEGELKDRNLGEQLHTRVQLILGNIFDNHRKEWNTRTSTELRVQVRPERFRIPDVCILRRSDPFEEIVTRAPLLCIKVLLLADTLGEMQERVDDYVRMGVANVWIVEPEEGVLRVAGTPIAVTLAEAFAELDEA